MPRSEPTPQRDQTRRHCPECNANVALHYGVLVDPGLLMWRQAGERSPGAVNLWLAEARRQTWAVPLAPDVDLDTIPATSLVTGYRPHRCREGTSARYTVLARITPDEHNAVEALAGQYHVTVSEVLLTASSAENVGAIVAGVQAPRPYVTDRHVVRFSVERTRGRLLEQVLAERRLDAGVLLRMLAAPAVFRRVADIAGWVRPTVGLPVDVACLPAGSPQRLIREAMWRRGLSVVDLARVARVSEGSLRRIFEVGGVTARSRMPPLAVQRVATYLQLDESLLAPLARHRLLDRATDGHDTPSRTR